MSEAPYPVPSYRLTACVHIEVLYRQTDTLYEDFHAYCKQEGIFPLFKSWYHDGQFFGGNYKPEDATKLVGFLVTHGAVWNNGDVPYRWPQ